MFVITWNGRSFSIIANWCHCQCKYNIINAWNYTPSYSNKPSPILNWKVVLLPWMLGKCSELFCQNADGVPCQDLTLHIGHEHSVKTFSCAELPASCSGADKYCFCHFTLANGDRIIRIATLFMCPLYLAHVLCLQAMRFIMCFFLNRF